MTPVFWPPRDPGRPTAAVDDGDLVRQRHYRTYMLKPQDYGWMGAYQFEYLLRLGLREGDRLLDIGCGSLRGGRLFIPYLRLPLLRTRAS